MHVVNEIKANKSADVFAADGPLSGILERYQLRQGQQKMAQLVEDAITQQKNRVVEAPSGSGKTFAYLVPVFVAGKKTIVSTATHYLQNQLYYNDIPMVQQALGSNRVVAVLKGRSNYLCPYYLEKSLSKHLELPQKIRLQLATLWQRFRESSLATWSELLPSLDTAALSYATCAAQECLGQQCPQLLCCPLMRAREQANRADVVIVNHSLLFSDQVMRREQFADLLPASQVVIVDEAHRLAEFAQTIVGDSLTSRQLINYCRDAITAVRLHAPEQKNVSDFLKQLEQVVNKLKKNLPLSVEYIAAQHVGIVRQLTQAFDQIAMWLNGASERAQVLRELEIRTQALKKALQNIQDAPGLCYVQATTHGFVLRNIPLSLSKLIHSLFAQSDASWVFTSATLAVLGNADKFLKCLGLSNHDFYCVDSPIEYKKNAMLYTPLLAVEPADLDYPHHLVTSAAELLTLIDGRVLFLFTSHDMLQKVSKLLREVCDRELFIQGDTSNRLLIEKFKQSEHAVLLGTGSFWEGLDLSGVPLAGVFIDKLPFVSPYDALVKLRSDDLSSCGVDSFQQFLLPDAVIRLRQGCGRLLRRLSDKGVIMIADPRLHSRQYGTVFINSLPAMNRSNHLAPIVEFLNHHLIVRTQKHSLSNENISP